MIRRVVFALFIGGILAHPASAQVPATGPVLPTPQAPPIRDQTDIPPPPPSPAVASRPDGPARSDEAKPAVPRSNPAPQRTSAVASASDPIARRDSLASQGRFANPGGVGRYSEYYTPYTPTSQTDRRPNPPARFGQGGAPNRAQQIAAFQAGQQRARNIQDNINVYGRPYAAYGAGFGYGFGLGAGGLYGGGYR